MNPTLIALGIQATLRAAQAGADLYGEHARDRKVFLPNLDLPVGSKPEQLILFLLENAQLADSYPVLADIWNSEQQFLKNDTPEAIDAAYAVMLQFKAEQQLTDEGKNATAIVREAELLAAGHMVEQWRDERRPPSPLVRVALTLTDIGLEFVAADPSIFGVGSRGEKLIVAFADNMSMLIPDSTADFGNKEDFADRVLGIFLRAGMASIASHSSAIFSDEAVAKLMAGITKPIVEALPC